MTPKVRSHQRVGARELLSLQTSKNDLGKTNLMTTEETTLQMKLRLITMLDLLVCLLHFYQNKAEHVFLMLEMHFVRFYILLKHYIRCNLNYM